MTAVARTTDMIEVRPGLRLAVEVVGPPDAMPIVFSNSLAADMRMWDEVADRLGPATRTVRYDTRGHGRSDVPQDGYTLAALGEDVLAIMDALRIERALVCGLSLGGLAAQWLAVNAPDRVSGLVLANTAASFPPPSLWEERARNARHSGIDQFVEPTLGRWFTPRFRTEHPARVAAIGDVIRATSVSGYAG
jgi:3-oxoadipate enol-lactonase